MIHFYFENEFYLENKNLWSQFGLHNIDFGFFPYDEFNTSNLRSKIIFYLYTSAHSLNLKYSFLAWKWGFIYQIEADSPFICPYNIDFRTQYPKIDLSTKSRKFLIGGTILPLLRLV